MKTSFVKSAIVAFFGVTAIAVTPASAGGIGAAASDLGDAAGKVAAEVGDLTSDAYVTSLAKTRLAANAKVSASDINVDTKAGVVTLFGIVPTVEAKQEAESQVEALGQVTSVRNYLEVVPEGEKSEQIAVDGELRHKIVTEIENSDTLAADRIEVGVANNTVRLTGTVSSEAKAQEAEDMAQGVAGVTQIRNDLEVEASASAQAEAEAEAEAEEEETE